MRGVAALVSAVLACASSDARADSAELDRYLLRVGDIGNEMGAHLRILSFDLVDMSFDVRHRRAKVRLGASGDRLALRLDSEIVLMDGFARVRARLELGVLGANLRFDLPQFDITSSQVFGQYGERAYEIRVPLFERRF